jgi:hypothetical protein
LILIPGSTASTADGIKSKFTKSPLLPAAFTRYDPNTIQFYEPVTIGVAFNNSFDRVGPGFDRVPGGWYYNDVSAYAYHIYCWYMETLGGDATDEERQQAAEDCTNKLLPRVFKAERDNVEV